MKNFLYLYILLLFASCSDFLTVEPVEQISINTQLSTKEGVLKALNGAYYKTRDIIVEDNFYTYGDLLSGNVSFSPNSSNGAISAPSFVDLIYNFSDDKNSSDMKGFYTGAYEGINNLNLILENVDNLKDATEKEKNQIKAESLALRTFLHFSLYKIYAQNYTYSADSSHLGIVYNSKTLKVGVDYPARKNAKEIFELLSADIEKAILLYNTEKAIPEGFIHQFLNINAAKTLAAEIALWKNDWANAIKWSDDVINNSGKTLSPSSEFTINWAQSEKIWDFGKTGESVNILGSIYNFTSNTNYSEYVISDDYTTLITTNDARKNLWETKILKNKTYNFPTKFKNINGLIYRISELYFIRAEANLRLGKTNESINDINIIRNRSGLGLLSNLSIDDLLLEKRKEFICENKYFWDLMRNHKNIKRTLGCISTNCSPTYPNDKFVAPIPQESIEINENMKQNPSY